MHLSDIHFCKPRKAVEDPYDLDADLRDQLEQDVARLRESVGPFDGIIVSGDIAFAGREHEYDVAVDWLRKLSGICGAKPEAVWCVPGNHDADRSVYDKSINLKNLHNTLRPSDAANVDAMLGEVLRDDEASATLFRPLEQYNRFASKFQCPSRPDALYWEHRLRLNDGSYLRLHGANSTLVSNWNDDNKAYKLILGTKQASAGERAGEVVVFICHHPIDWLMDYEAVTPALNSRAKVQLFGHKHLQTVDVTNGCLRIVAGSVQPDRREPKWRPRYNCLGFAVRSDAAGSRELVVDVYPRVWSENEPKFIADFASCDGAQHKEYPLALPKWEAPVPQSAPPAEVRADESGAASLDPEKTLTYRFLSLPHLIRLEIAQEFELLREEDEGLFDAELIVRLLQRAAEGDRLADLWDRLKGSDGDDTINPYR